MRMPGSTMNGVSRSVFSRTTRISPAVAGVDQSGRVDDPYPVSRGETGPGLDEPRVPFGNLDCDPGRHDSALSRSEYDGLARGQVEPRVAVVGLVRQRARPRARVESRRRSSCGHLELVVVLRDEEAREPRRLGARKPRAYADTFGSVTALRDRRAELVEVGQCTPVRVRHEESHVLEAIGEELGDSRLQRLETLARPSGDQERAWIGVLDPAA